MAAFELLDRSLLAYVGVTLGYALAIGVAAYVLRRRGSIKPAELLPVLAESVLLAVVMFFTVGWATHQIFSVQVGPAAMGPFEKLVMAAGAGFHEELVFRVGLFAGGTLALKKLARLSEAKSAWIASLVSSLLFSAVHYIGPLGDPFELVSFTFRFLAGLYLAAVYRFRGFVVAVYTHPIDVAMVTVLRPGRPRRPSAKRAEVSREPASSSRIRARSSDSFARRMVDG